MFTEFRPLLLAIVLFLTQTAFANQYLYEGSLSDATAYYTRINAPGNLSSWHAQYLGCNPYRIVFFQNSHLGVVRLMRMARSGQAFSVSNFANANAAIARMNYEKSLDTVVNPFRCNFIQSVPRADFAARVKPGSLPLVVAANAAPTAFSKTLMSVGQYFSATLQFPEFEIVRPGTEAVPSRPYAGKFDLENPVLPRRLDSAEDLRELSTSYPLDSIIAPEVLRPLLTSPPNPNNTVTMAYKNHEIRFFAYNTLGVLTPGVILDGEVDSMSNPVVKYIPGNCTTCHGGTPIDHSSNPALDDGRNVNALFFPMDYNALKFPKLVNPSNPSLGYNLNGTYNDLTAVEKFILWRMNRAVSQTNTTVSAYQSTPNGFSPYINSVLYSNINDPTTGLLGRVPPDYDNAIDRPNYSNGARQVGCAGCHQARGTNFDSKPTLMALQSTSQAYHASGFMPFSFHGEVRDQEPATHCYVRKWIDPTLNLNCNPISTEIQISNYPVTKTEIRRPTYPIVSVPAQESGN